MKDYDLIAVDVSKDTLQLQTTTKAFLISNDRAGLRKLVTRLRKLTHPLVVCEASGGYERPLLEAMRDAGIGCRVINPRRIRAFAISEGIHAKTDRIDAQLILRFAQEKKLQAAPPLSAHQQALADLLDRRSHLTEQIAREKNRLQKASKLTATFIKGMISYAERQLASLDRAIRLHIAKDPALQAQARTFITVKGVGEVTAWTLLAYLSEITSLKRNQLVALSGIAPFNRDSGATSAQRHIGGGRAKVRRCLYMAAHTAATCNPVIRPYVQGLLARGKPYKVAIVAAMRKLLIHLQSLLKHSQPFPVAS